MKRRISRILTASILCMLLAPVLSGAETDHWHDRVRAEASATERPWLGIAILDITPEVITSIKTNVTEGLLVSDVNNGGPADSAGVGIGDVILKLDGVEIIDAGDFASRIRGLKAGATVNLQVSRNGVVEELEVTLGRMPYLPPAQEMLPYIPTAELITQKMPSSGPGANVRTAQAESNDSSTELIDISADFSGAKEPGTCAKSLSPVFFHGPGQNCGQMISDWNYGTIYLRAIDALGLTGEQRAKAEGIWPEYLKKSIKAGADIKVAEIELRELTSSEAVNLDKVRQKLSDISAKRSELSFFRIKTFEDFKKILTPEQRLKLKDIIAKGGLSSTGQISSCKPCDRVIVEPTDLSDATGGSGVE